MSLINQMLRDLEARSPAAPAAGVLDDLHAADTSPGSGPGWWRVAAIGLLFVTLALVLVPGARLHSAGSGESRAMALPLPVPQPRAQPVREPATPVGRRAEFAAPVPPVEPVPPAGRPETVPAPVASPVAQAAQPAPRIPPPEPAAPARVDRGATGVPTAPGTASRSPEPVELRSPAAGATTPGAVSRRVLPRTPGEEAEAVYRHAVRAVRDGDPEADGLLREALASDPSHVKARQVLGARLFAAGRPRDAAEVLAEGLRRVPGEPGLAKVYARVLLELGKVKAARDVLEAAAPPISSDPDYHGMRAAVLQRSGDHTAAVEAYRGALMSRPTSGAWWVGLGISLEALGEMEDARQAFARALGGGTLDPALRRFVEDRLDAGAS